MTPDEAKAFIGEIMSGDTGELLLRLADTVETRAPELIEACRVCAAEKRGMAE